MSKWQYGQPPASVGLWPLPEWAEYMHYLYLPVAFPRSEGQWANGVLRLPPNLEFLRPLIVAAWNHEGSVGHFSNLEETYTYVTARRGYATPGNPLNRPGWHADGFGSNDINYIWSDRWPTRFAVGQFEGISDDHVRSAEQFDEQVGGMAVDVREGIETVLYRLDPSVVHATPVIPAPGGDRSFLKISISPNRYNLRGNSHNHEFDYDWKMWDRSEIRNDPAYAGGDAGPQ